MTAHSASLAGTFRIGGELEVNRIGFGAMRVTGPGIWGEPEDRAAALETLQRVPELGVNFIDTADSYGPETSEKLIREALHPYTGLVIATKAGLTRTGPDVWIPNGRPEYLIAQASRSRDLLGIDRIDLWQLHRLDPRVPQAEQFAAVKELLDSGAIRFAGLSGVSVAQIKAAQALFPVATVQNRYNLVDRENDDVVAYCEQQGIGFIPWYPLAAGRLTRGGGSLDRIARQHHGTPAQIVLAWILQRSPVMLPIPGTSRVAHLEENVAAARIRLSQEELEQLERGA